MKKLLAFAAVSVLLVGTAEACHSCKRPRCGGGCGGGFAISFNTGCGQCGGHHFRLFGCHKKQKCCNTAPMCNFTVPVMQAAYTYTTVTVQATPQAQYAPAAPSKTIPVPQAPSKQSMQPGTVQQAPPGTVIQPGTVPGPPGAPAPGTQADPVPKSRIESPPTPPVPRT